MKWYTHQTLGSALALSCGAAPVYLPIIWVGCVIPDMIDHTIARGDPSVWRRIHRQTSHWIGWYLILALIGWALVEKVITIDLQVIQPTLQNLGVTKNFLRSLAQLGPQYLGQACLWFSFGCICHVLMDALTPMRVPIFPRGGKRRWGYSLVSTGTWKESVFFLISIGLLGYFGLSKL